MLGIIKVAPTYAFVLFNLGATHSFILFGFAKTANIMLVPLTYEFCLYPEWECHYGCNGMPIMYSEHWGS